MLTGTLPCDLASMICRRLVCQHLHESGQCRSQAAAASTGAPSAADAAAAEDFLKVTICRAELHLCCYAMSDYHGMLVSIFGGDARCMKQTWQICPAH